MCCAVEAGYQLRLAMTADEKKARRSSAFGPRVTLVGKGLVVIPSFSPEQVRYLDDQRRIAANVDERERIGGCKRSKSRLDS